MIYKFLLLFCLYLPFQLALNPSAGVDLASGRVFVILLFLAWLTSSLKNKRLFIPFKIQTLLILSFLFISAFSLFWAENLDWGLRKLLFLLSIFPVYFATAGIISAVAPSERDESRGDIKIIKFLVWGAGIAAFIGMIQFLLQFIIGLDQTAGIWRNYVTPLFLGKSFTQAVLEYPSWLVNIGGHNYLRAFATFPDPHMFSFYLGLALPLALSLFFYARTKCHPDPAKEGEGSPNYIAGALNNGIPLPPRRDRNDKIYLFLFLIILLADLLTFSRGGYAGLAAGLIFILIYVAVNKKVSLKKLLVSLILITVLFIVAVISPVGQRFISSFNAEEGSNKSRFENWRQAVDIIKNNPLGAGIGNYSYEIEPSAGYRKPIYAHNLYLDIAAETGIVNAIIWATLIIASIISLARSRQAGPPPPCLAARRAGGRGGIMELGAAASLIIFSVHSVFDTALYSIQVLPLLLIIIALNIKNNYALYSDRSIVHNEKLGICEKRSNF